MTGATHDLDLIRDYLVGRLTERERLVFQDRIARDPALARELEHSIRLREGLRQLKGQGYFDTRGMARGAQRRANLRGWLAAGAAAVLAIVCIGLAWELRGDSALSLSAGPGGAPLQWSFVSTRGDALPLEAPASGSIELRIAPEQLVADRYRVSLLRLTGDTDQSIGTVAGVTPEGDGYLHVFVAAAQLSPGNYRLRIQTDDGSATHDFPFTLAAHGAPAPATP